MNEKGSKLSRIIERLAWAALTIIAYYAADKLKEMSVSIVALNTNVAVLIEKVSNQNDKISSLEERVQRLERLRR